MARLQNSYEVKLIRESGKIAALALKEALNGVKEKVSGLDINKIATNTIYKLGGDLSYKTVPGYKYATCITINEQVVHGVPTEYKFKDGDIISVDLAVEYRGWHTDTAWTVLVGKGNDDKRKFLRVGEEALWEAVRKATDDNRIGDISSAIQQKIEEAGYSVVRSLVGHGVGKSLHEDPEVPGYGEPSTGMVLKSGMSLAIEVIYTQGLPDVVLDKDGWTFISADGSLAGLFEMTVLVGKKKTEVLTDWRRT